MEKFYTRVLNAKKEQEAIEVAGYIIVTDKNRFGFYKNQRRNFDIIDLGTGLSINYLRYFRLRDLKEDLNLFEEKLEGAKEKNATWYNEQVEIFNKLKEKVCKNV